MKERMSEWMTQNLYSRNTDTHTVATQPNIWAGAVMKLNIRK